MAHVTKQQAEAYWKKYNKDGNDELTVDEVKACLKEVYETVDDEDVKQQFRFFGQEDAKSLKKDDFIKGMMRTKKCDQLKTMFKAMDKDGNGRLDKDELKNGLAGVGIEGEQAEIILDELECDDDGKYSCDEFIDVAVFSEDFMKLYGGWQTK